MINQHLKRIRMSSGKTQEDLAKCLCISTQSVSKWEKGQSLPSIEMLPKIADFYNCTINAFFSEYELEIFERMNKNAPSDEDVTNFLISLIPQLTIKHPESNEEISAEDSIPTEALFLPRVYELLKDHNIVSSGMLQRELGLGYGLAARIVDALVSIGIAVFNSENKTYKIRKDKIHLIEPYIK